MTRKHLELFYHRHAGALHRANVNTLHEEYKQRSWNSRIANALTGVYGSIYFFYALVLFSVAWIFLQEVLGNRAWDPLPFALLLLAGNFVQLFGGPIIQVGANYSAAHHELKAEADYHVNEKNAEQIEHLRKMVGAQNSVMLSVQSQVKEIRTTLKLAPPVDKEHCLSLIDSIRTDLMPVHRYIHATTLATEQQARLMLVWNALSELALLLGSRREEETLE